MAVGPSFGAFLGPSRLPSWSVWVLSRKMRCGANLTCTAIAREKSTGEPRTPTCPWRWSTKATRRSFRLLKNIWKMCFIPNLNLIAFRKLKIGNNNWNRFKYAIFLILQIRGCSYFFSSDTDDYTQSIDDEERQKLSSSSLWMQSQSQIENGKLLLSLESVFSFIHTCCIYASFYAKFWTSFEKI